MTEVLIFIAQIVIGVPIAFVLGFFALCFAGVLAYTIFHIWWLMLYLFTFSFVTNLIPEPPGPDSGAYYKK